MKSPIRRTKMWIFCPFHRRYVSNSMVSVISVLFMRYKGGNFIIYTRHFSKLREWIASQVREIFIYFLLISVISSEPYRPSPFPATRKQLKLCSGLKMTSCKSGKDRTGMSVTLQQVNILSREFDLADCEYQRALDTMRRWLAITTN